MGADYVVTGPPTSSGTNPSATQAVVLDRTNNLLGVSGANQKLNWCRIAPVVLPAQTALTAITTAQTLLSTIFNAGMLALVGRRIRVKGSLIYSTTSTNVATISLALTLGGVTLATITTAATNTAASTNLPIQFEFEFTVASVGASGTLQSHGRVDANIGTTAAAAIATYLDTNTAVSSAVNLTAASTMTVTIAASAAVPSAQLLDAVVEVVA